MNHGFTLIFPLLLLDVDSKLVEVVEGFSYFWGLFVSFNELYHEVVVLETILLCKLDLDENFVELFFFYLFIQLGILNGS